MGNKDPRIARLWKEIDEIFWNDWDPCGVNDALEARDEYYSYIYGVYILLDKKASKDDIVHHLFQIESERMGMKPNIKKLEVIADKLLKIQMT